MQLTHTCDDSLSCLLIRVRTESRVFLCKFRKRLAHLALTSLGLRLNRKLDNRLREFHGLQDNGMLLVTNSIAGCGKLKPYGRRNIAGIHFVKLCPLVCVHLQDTSDTLLLVLRRIVHIGTGIAGA